MSSSLAARIRQLQFPKELRIEEDARALVRNELRELETLLAYLQPTPDVVQTAPLPALAPADVGKGESPVFLRLANAAWRIKQQAERVGEPNIARALRGKVDLLIEVLRAEGVELIDASGRDFDFGDHWDDVVTSAETKLRPYIESMRSPRIMHRGRLIQAGTPVVADRPVENPNGGNP